MSLQPLLTNQPVTAQGHQASLELVLVLQQIVATVRDLEAQNAALAARVAALEP